MILTHSDTLRTRWENEATHFTPWLAEHIALLGDALGMELAPPDREQFVGRYRADLIARDLRTDTLVLIENQLEQSDHAHLGQLLTYAAGVQAGTVVWIAKEITYEHQRTLSWLNTVTDVSVSFYGVEVALVGKDGVEFRAVSYPEHSRKTIEDMMAQQRVELAERKERIKEQVCVAMLVRMDMNPHLRYVSTNFNNLYQNHFGDIILPCLQRLLKRGLIQQPSFQTYASLKYVHETGQLYDPTTRRRKQVGQKEILLSDLPKTIEEYIAAVNAPTVPLDIKQLPEDQQTIVLNVLNGKGTR